MDEHTQIIKLLIDAAEGFRAIIQIDREITEAFKTADEALNKAYKLIDELGGL